MDGRLHSVQTLGAVDGPGLRFVAFLQGCPLRCPYCHNPDTWEETGGQLIAPESLAQQALRYRAYYRNGGGVTLSGGEALWQPEFAAEFFSLVRKEGLHTALDTSGIGRSREQTEEVLAQTDLVIADVKFTTDGEYRRHCGVSLERVTEFLRWTEEKKIPLWVRHVVVPGLTDGEENILRLKELTRGFSNLEKVELLPFRKLCISKYRQLGIPFPLEQTPACPDALLTRLNTLL